jgi:hypothetical protein
MLMYGQPHTCKHMHVIIYMRFICYTHPSHLLVLATAISQQQLFGLIDEPCNLQHSPPAVLLIPQGNRMVLLNAATQHPHTDMVMNSA